MQPGQANVLPILWVSFFSAHVLFAGVSTVVAPVADLGPAAAVFGLVALLPAGLAAEGGILARAITPAQSWFIVRFAMAESAAILGLVAFLTSGSHLVQLGCAALGLVAHLLSFPSEGALARYAATRSGR
jgi:hypothetical protein